MNLFWLAIFCFCTFFFATWLTFNWIKAKIVAKEGGVKWHKVETLLGGIVILHWKLPREEGGWGNWPAILFRKPLSCTSGAFRIHLIYIPTIKTWNYETVWKEDWGHCSRKKERLEHRYPSADCRADGPLRRICRLLFGFCLAMTAGGDFYVGGLWMFCSELPQKRFKKFSANPTFSECRAVTLQYHIRYSLAILTNYFAFLTT